MELSFEEASKKIQNLSEFKDFKPDMVAYNRHGIAVFGSDGEDYAFYWANPYEEGVRKMENAECRRYRGGGSTMATSKDGFVNFYYSFKEKNFYLNSELATRIPLRK